MEKRMMKKVMQILLISILFLNIGCKKIKDSKTDTVNEHDTEMDEVLTDPYINKLPPAKTAPVKPDPTKPPPVRPTPIEPAPTKPDPVKPAPVKPAPTESDPVKPGLLKLDPMIDYNALQVDEKLKYVITEEECTSDGSIYDIDKGLCKEKYDWQKTKGDGNLKILHASDSQVHYMGIYDPLKTLYMSKEYDYIIHTGDLTPKGEAKWLKSVADTIDSFDNTNILGKSFFGLFGGHDGKMNKQENYQKYFGPSWGIRNLNGIFLIFGISESSYLTEEQYFQQLAFYRKVHKILPEHAPVLLASHTQMDHRVIPFIHKKFHVIAELIGHWHRISTNIGKFGQSLLSSGAIKNVGEWGVYSESAEEIYIKNYKLEKLKLISLRPIIEPKSHSGSLRLLRKTSSRLVRTASFYKNDAKGVLCYALENRDGPKRGG